MNRQALIVGINTYDTQHLKNLTSPAKDADAIAQLLIDRGNVQLRLLPAFNLKFPFDKSLHRMRILA